MKSLIAAALIAISTQSMQAMAEVPAGAVSIGHTGDAEFFVLSKKPLGGGKHEVWYREERVEIDKYGAKARVVRINIDCKTGDAWFNYMIDYDANERVLSQSKADFSIPSVPNTPLSEAVKHVCQP